MFTLVCKEYSPVSIFLKQARYMILHYKASMPNNLDEDIKIQKVTSI